jgi:hypothetical protein
MLSRRGLMIGSTCAALAAPADAFLQGRAAATPPSPESDEEFVGPFASWVNVVTAYGADPSGTNNSATAFQNALNSFSGANTPRVLWVPAGTYLIGSTITLTAAYAVSIIGQDPTTTTLKYTGTSGGTLLVLNGCAYGRVGRLTFEGNNYLAGILIDQTTQMNVSVFDTGNEYADCIFQNANQGINAGDFGGAAESSILRCRFNNIGAYGLLLNNFNALDWWFWYCTFTNNSSKQSGGAALSNYSNSSSQAGNYHAYYTLFSQPAGSADFFYLNTGLFSMRNCVSLTLYSVSTVFYGTNAAQIRVQGNQFVNSNFMGNMGPWISSDNIYYDTSTGAHAALNWNSYSAPDFMLAGDQFASTSPVQWDSGTNWSARARSITSNSTFGDTLTAPTSLPSPYPFLPNNSRQVFAVAPGASAAKIQAAINNAMARNGNRPIVHLPAGTYDLSQALTIPSSDIMLVGDGACSANSYPATILTWGGPGPGIILQGPASNVQLRDFYLNGGTGGSTTTGIAIQKADSGGAGGRVFGQGCQFNHATGSALFVDSLDYTYVEMRDCVLTDGVSDSARGVGMQVIGGPQAFAGSPKSAKVLIASGTGGHMFLTHQISHGATVIVRDFWKDSGNTYAQVSDNSTVIFESSLLNLTSGSTLFNFTGFTGIATIIGCQPASNARLDAASTGQLWITENNFQNGNNVVTYTPVNNGSASVFFNSNRWNNSGTNGSVPITDLTALPSSGQITNFLAPMRNAVASQVINRMASNQTDIRMYRVWCDLGQYGTHITA